MSTTATNHANSMPRVRKRREVPRKNEGKRFSCHHEGCGRMFTRGEHLSRHLLNHSTGEYTCDRCRAHFKRHDLLERHIARHRQKDQEAGAEGCGILNTRKRMWKDLGGNIVTKKPILSNNTQEPDQPTQGGNEDSIQPFEFIPLGNQQECAPISPPTSHNSRTQSWDDHDSGLGLNYPHAALDPSTLSASDSYSPLDQQFWSQPQHDPLVSTTFDDTSFDAIFNPDTASSFNNPFTTMSNYNWLFDMDLSKADQVQQTLLSSSGSDTNLNHSTIAQPSDTFDLQSNHMNVRRPDSTNSQIGHYIPHHIDTQHVQSLGEHLLVPPLRNPDSDTHYSDNAQQTPASGANLVPPSSRQVQVLETENILEFERPMSMLQSSKSLPVIDELARAQVLDLIDITQPTAPDGSIVMRDHPLLALNCLQTYCDLFFTRFNAAYPLIHMSTFDPSGIDALLLISVLLLGATYSEKDAHQLAVCIHDNIRPQIFANASFSAKPSLWMLQTILLVECFGKSRAGQKQHEMSHLFHGLLINLIRRSDCQNVYMPTSENSSSDLEDDWLQWCDAEQKKRLAFLCFMWDTQHAVLFCQSLCMSAFELRSNLPCDQSVWEASSAEVWQQLRQKQPTAPRFLSCLKMYLHPSVSAVPGNLNAFSRSLLLHGLMSVAWDMQRRDQTSLGVIEANPLGNWQERLETSYTAWRNDYEAFCSQYMARLPSSDHFLAKELQVARAATLALFHSACILLRTPFLDIQIYAGARHILGRPVARNDYVRSQKVVKKWVNENAPEANKAVWHAASLMTDGVEILDEELSSSESGSGRLWHHPWAIYLGALVIWSVWYARPAPDQLLHHAQDDEDDIIWDPKAEVKVLLDAVLRGKLDQSPDMNYTDIANALSKKGTNSLAVVASKCLSKVRWAVVHDGTMVLKGLVQWRLVGDGGLGGI